MKTCRMDYLGLLGGCPKCNHLGPSKRGGGGWAGTSKVGAVMGGEGDWSDAARSQGVGRKRVSS